MAKLKMDEAKTLKSIVGTLSSILDEADFELGPDGLKAENMDSSHVVLVDLELVPEAFQSYEAPEPTEFALDLSRTKKVFSRGKARDEVELEVDGERGRLKVVFRGDSTRRFELPLMDPVNEELPELDVDITAEAELPASLLKKALLNAEIVDGNASIKFGEDSLAVSAESEVQTFDMEVPTSAVERLEVDSEVENVYDIDYLKDTLGAAGGSETVSLRTGSGLPITVETVLVNGWGSLVCHLAPRVKAE